MSRGPAGEPLRVVQWATGNIGSRSLRTVIEHPRLNLVGVYVHSADKAGRDAGELIGLAPVGVTATTSIDDILRLKPDCVLYMQQGTDFDDVCRLLESGVNVVTTRGDVHFPDHMDQQLRARIEDACRRGGTSIHSTGSSPGFISEALPLVLTSLERRLDSVTIDEFADMSRRDSPEMIFEIMGYGKPASVFDERRRAMVEGSFAGSLYLLAHALSMPLDDVVAVGEFALAKQTFQIAAGTIDAGTVAAQRIVVSGMRNGTTLLQFRANWYCTRDVDVDWELRENGWRVQVAGDTPLDISIRFPIPVEDYPLVMPGLTAHRAVNAVPFVCAAEPGIRTTVDLPQIIADLG